VFTLLPPFLPSSLSARWGTLRLGQDMVRSIPGIFLPVRPGLFWCATPVGNFWLIVPDHELSYLISGMVMDWKIQEWDHSVASFIVLLVHPGLCHKPTPRSWGYCYEGRQRNSFDNCDDQKGRYIVQTVLTGTKWWLVINFEPSWGDLKDKGPLLFGKIHWDVDRVELQPEMEWLEMSYSSARTIPKSPLRSAMHLSPGLVNQAVMDVPAMIPFSCQVTWTHPSGTTKIFWTPAAVRNFMGICLRMSTSFSQAYAGGNQWSGGVFMEDKHWRISP